MPLILFQLPPAISGESRNRSPTQTSQTAVAAHTPGCSLTYCPSPPLCSHSPCISHSSCHHFSAFTFHSCQSSGVKLAAEEMKLISKPGVYFYYYFLFWWGKQVRKCEDRAAENYSHTEPLSSHLHWRQSGVTRRFQGCASWFTLAWLSGTCHCFETC